MGFLSGLKGQKALQLHGKGDLVGAKAAYVQAIQEGVNQPRVLLGYATLLLREGSYQQAREILVQAQKAPGLTADQRVQMFVNYAACMFRLGDIDKGINLLERQHQKQPTGTVYQTLGYLYVEKYLPEHKPATPVAVEHEEEQEAEALANVDEQWADGVQKAFDFVKEAVDYDDEDAVCLDNLAQFYYRVLGDHESAKPWFVKALEVKEGQIDTLCFLSLYDVESGDKAAAIEKLEKALEGRFSPLNHFSKEKVESMLYDLKV